MEFHQLGSSRGHSWEERNVLNCRQKLCTFHVQDPNVILRPGQGYNFAVLYMCFLLLQISFFALVVCGDGRWVGWGMQILRPLFFSFFFFMNSVCCWVHTNSSVQWAFAPSALLGRRCKELAGSLSFLCNWPLFFRKIFYVKNLCIYIIGIPYLVIFVSMQKKLSF